MSRTCIYCYSCANHDTAGDFRSESGISPRLILLENGRVDCNTKHLPSNEDVRYETIPLEEHNQGMVILNGNCEFEVYSIFDEN